MLAERERLRGDRTLGQALAQVPVVHAHGAYDLEVDTSTLDPERAADVVLSWLADGEPDASARWRRELDT